MSAPACAGGGGGSIGLEVVQCQTLGVGQDRYRLALHRGAGCLDDGAGTGACSSEIGSANEPFAANPLAIGLTRGGITRIGIEGMSVVLDLVAVGCRHRRQRTWERGGAGRIT